MFGHLASLATIAATLLGLQVLSTAADPDVVIRRVWVAENLSTEPWSVTPNGTVSPDGEWIAYVNGQNQIVRYRIGDGQQFVVTAPEDAAGVYNLAWSPGFDQVAYFRISNESCELRVAGVAGGTPRVILRRAATQNTDTEYIPLGWAAGGNSLVVNILTENGDDFATVSLDTGETRVFKTIQRQQNSQPKVSVLAPDRTSVTVGRTEGTNREIFSIDIDTGRETDLVRHAANDFPIAWSPDGKRLLFASDRGGSLAVWSVEVRDGKAFGLPVKVPLVAGVPISGSIAQDQTLYVALNRISITDVYTADWDPQSGRVTGQLIPAADRYATFNSAPDWSPNGDRFVLQIGGPDNPDGIDLLVRSLSTGEERIIRPQVRAFSRPRFSPDGRSVAVQGGTLSRPPAIGALKIDLETGIATLLASGGRNPTWSRDGGRLFYELGSRSVMMRDEGTGTVSEIYRRSGPQRNFNSAPSPDGDRVGVVDGPSLYVVEVENRQAKKILELNAPERFEFPGSLAWTPDGKWLLFGKMNGARGELWRISPEGNEAQFTGLEVPDKFIYFLRVSPDGRQLAFAIGDATLQRREIWALEKRTN